MLPSGLNFFDNDPYLSRNGKYLQIKGAGTVISMDATLEFLSKHKDGDKPMFTVTWFPSPHNPHPEIPQGMKNAATLYKNEKTKLPGYFREITLLDQQIGRLRKHLRKLGIEKNTLCLYCSDNGGLVTESSGGRAKKGSIYEGGLRVPAVLEWPARFSAKEIDVPAFSSDLYPTLLSVAGINQPSKQPILDGIDLLPILDGKKRTRTPMGFWHGFRNGQGTWSDRIIKALWDADKAGKPNPHPERILKNVKEFPAFDMSDLEGHAAWNEWPWKLHRIERKDKVTFELYDLTKDPMETTDLSDKETARVSKMKTSLENWQRSVLNSWAGKDY